MIRKSGFSVLLLVIALIGYGQFKTKYPDIPRIDVHTHVAGDRDANDKYMDLRKIINDWFSADFAFWINLSDRSNPVNDPDSISSISHGRSLCAFGDYSPHTGLQYSPADIPGLIEKGFIGYKLWYGTKSRRLKQGEQGFPYVDDPNNKPMLSALEKLHVPALSMHIADPNGPFGERTRWCPDPVEFWRMITAFKNMLDQHPDLVVVGAHCLWLICQDAQIDYLRYLLSTNPNLYIDLAATDQYYRLVNHDNLRNFMIEYSDRILFGTDMGRWKTMEETESTANRLICFYRILETDDVVQGCFFGKEPIKGLNLPREVLEKIYYKNAVRLYPGIKEKLQRLGYLVTL